MNVPANSSSYRPDIDGLRAIAVMAVVINHLSPALIPGGFVGVDVFFVISGYLITGIIRREIAAGQFSFARFYERRARRIFPALFAMLAATLLLAYVLFLPSDLIATLRGAIGSVLFASNFVFWRDMQQGYFAATDVGLNPLLHTWSLAVEEQFYILFPVFLLLCSRLARRPLAALMLAGAAISLAAAVWLLPTKLVAVFFLAPFRAWELLAGALLAIGVVPQLRSQVTREIVAGSGLLAIGVACWAVSSSTPFPGLAALAPVLGAAAIIHAGNSGSSLVARLLTLRPVVYIGLISYSLYLWHWPLIVFTRYSQGTAPITQYLLPLLAASLILAALSYHFIEKPFRRAPTAKRSQRGVFALSAVVASTLAGVAVVGLMNNGFPQRFSPEVLSLDAARSPKVPFVHCDGKGPAAAAILDCQLGAQHVKNDSPGVMLWGDSHTLAWAPALNEALARTNQRGSLVFTSTCPPLIGVGTTYKQNDCGVSNQSTLAYLKAHPEIHTVVMAAIWSGYFKQGGVMTTDLAGTTPFMDLVAAQQVLLDTVQWLHDTGRHVILVGPVPIFDTSVPLALALERHTGQKFLQSTEQAQNEKNAVFLQAAQTAAARFPLQWLAPIQWMCGGGGMSQRRGWRAVLSGQPPPQRSGRTAMGA